MSSECSRHPDKFIQTKMNESVPISKQEIRRDELLARVENKVETIEELKVFAEVNEHLSVEELQIESDRQLELIKSKFSEKLGRLAEYKKVHSELMELIGPMDSILESEDFVASGELLDKENELTEKENELKKDTDVVFLVKVEKFFENLVKKRTETLQLQKLFQDNEKLFYVRLAVIMGLKKSGDLKDVGLIWGGYSLSLLCGDNLVSKIDSLEAGNNGCHFPGSVINAVSGKNKNWQSTVVHENNHNLEEMFGDSGTQYSDQLLNNLNAQMERLLRLRELQAPEALMAGIEETIKNKVAEYCYQNFNEIVADIDRIGERGIATFLSNFRRALNAVEKFVEQVKDPEIKNWLMASLDETEENFAGILKDIGDMFFAAKELGDVDKAKASLILFHSENIDEALKYLSWHFGPRFDFLVSLRPVLQGGAYFPIIEKLAQGSPTAENRLLLSIFGVAPQPTNRAETFDLKLATKTDLSSFFELDNIRLLAETLAKDESLKLTEQEKEKFGQLFDDSSPETVSRLTNDEFLELVEKILFIAQRLELPKLVSFGLENISYQYFAKDIYRAIGDNDFTKPLDLFKRWPFDKSLLLNVLNDDGGYFIEECADKTNIQKFYQDLGLGEFFAEFLKEAN